ncbi:M56 family metallopeptidase [Crossiella cryophila]|uniref:Zn-dependent protease with chaperone function n=1 Tax=Crossiella cryophila TaxID=43355 RepID=A0A7W7FUK4_9PSEU|nr:M56 family metallopeptidase [Crossiella cryophila]MBB4678352.1 Zn-dependent protease with chaperone function [Crossiella cryophila]
MTAGLLLITTALALAWYATPALRLARRTLPPALTLTAWVLTTIGALLALPTGIALLLFPEVTTAAWSATVHRCWTALREAGLFAPETALHTTAVLLVTLLLTRLLLTVIPHARRVRHSTGTHRDALALLATPIPGHPTVVTLPHDQPLAYSLAGTTGPTVVSTALLDQAPEAELAAVLTHEQAHRTRRHHLVVAGFAALRKAFPFVPLFRAAPGEVALLTELDADAVAARAHGVPAVLAALRAFPHHPAAPGEQLATRIAQLSRPGGRCWRWVAPVLVLGCVVVGVGWVGNAVSELCVLSLVLGAH